MKKKSQKKLHKKYLKNKKTYKKKQKMVGGIFGFTGQSPPDLTANQEIIKQNKENLFEEFKLINDKIKTNGLTEENFSELISFFKKYAEIPINTEDKDYENKLYNETTLNIAKLLIDNNRLFEDVKPIISRITKISTGNLDFAKTAVYNTLYYMGSFLDFKRKQLNEFLNNTPLLNDIKLELSGNPTNKFEYKKGTFSISVLWTDPSGNKINLFS